MADLEEVELLRTQKRDAEDRLQKISRIWEKAFAEFQNVKDTLQSEIEAHEQTKQRLEHQQQLFETLTRVATAGLDEYNQLKKEYARECALRKEYEQRLSISSESPSPSRESMEQAMMSKEVSNVYLIPTLTELGSRLDVAENELAAANQRAEKAEKNLERVQLAATNALEEFNQLKKRYAEELARRQEAERLVLGGDHLPAGEKRVSAVKGAETVEDLKKALETERQLRKLAENDVTNLCQQLNQQQGKNFDLMTVTELECKLEDAMRSLKSSTERSDKIEQENTKLRAEVEELQRRIGESSAPPPPPPPPPPIFAAVPTHENLRKRIGVLKTKLQGKDAPDDQLADLRNQAMLELQEKLRKRSQMQDQKEKEGQGQGQGHKETGQMANLADVLKKTKTEPKALKAPAAATATATASGSSGSARNFQSLDDVLGDLDKEFESFRT